MDESSPYLGYWPSRGSAHFPGATSPTVADPATATPGANALRNDNEPDDASFAVSYRAEASPLFNPFSQPRTNPGPSIVSLGMTNDATATPTWTWQPESSVLDNNHDASQSSPILGHDVPMRKENAPVAQSETIWDDDVVPESTPGDEVRLSQAAPTAFTFNTASQQSTAEEPKAELIETSIDIEMKVEVNQPVPDDSDMAVADAVEPSAAEEEQQTEPEAPADEEVETLSEPEVLDASSPRSLELEQAEVDTQLDESIVEEPTFPSPPRDEPVLSHSVSEQDVPESAQRRSLGAETEDESDQMEVDIPARIDEMPPSSPDGLAPIEESPAPESSAKTRRRRSANDLLNAAADAFVERDYQERRNRRASAPPTKPVQSKTPQTKASRTSARTSVARATHAPVLKAGRKSMPAKLATETPKKRGRPRKSEGAATPVTVTKSAVKRGRPRKSDASPATKSTAVKPASARSQRVLKLTKVTTITKTTTTPSKSATPRKDGRLRRVVEGVSSSSTPSDGTPKRRGRPPKSAQSTPGLPVGTPRSARSAKTAQTDPPKKRGRPVTPRVVPSPIKRGRPPKQVASPVKEPASAKSEPKKRGRPSLIAQAEKSAASSPSDTPKRRGRPPKNPAPAPVPEVKALKEPVTKKRGRGAVAEDEDIPAELPAPTRKRGRAAKATVDAAAKAEPARPAKRRGRVAAVVPDIPTELPAPTRKRGRAAKATVEETKAEPAPKKQRTTRQAKIADEPVEAPAPKRGRGRKAAVVEAPLIEEVAKPKGRGRGRKATVEAVEAPVEEEAPKPKGRPRGRKAAAAEEAVVEAEPAKPKGRGRAKRSAPEPEPAAEPAKPARRGRAAANAEAPVVEEPVKSKARGRGRQAAAKTEAPPPVEPVVEEPKPARRGRAGKGELPISKAVTEEAPKRKGRAAKATAEGALAKAAAPKGVVKKGKAAPKKKVAAAAAPAIRSLRSRG